MSTLSQWRKSSHSGGQQNCIEMAWQELDLTLRDSKNPSGPRLSFPGAAFHTFLGEVIGTLDA